MLGRASRDDGRIFQNTRVGKPNEGASLTVQVEYRSAFLPFARDGRNAFYSLAHLVKAHLPRIEANRSIALPHAESLVYRIISGNCAADSEAQRDKSTQQQGAGADARIVPLLGCDRAPCQRRLQTTARYRARPTWREADVAVALP